MDSQNWAEKDIDRGISYLADHEEQATTDTIITAGENMTILLPSGLPAYGANITGMFMMAPLIVFIAILLLFPAQIISSTHGISSFTIVLALCFLLLIWGLIKVIRLMLKNRDLFPRCYFVTLGRVGISMHFTRLHFPFHPPRMAATWKEIQSVRKNKGLFYGFLSVTTLEVVCSDGKKLLIPFRLPNEQSESTAEEIESLIQKKIKN